MVGALLEVCMQGWDKARRQPAGIGNGLVLGGRAWVVFVTKVVGYYGDGAGAVALEMCAQVSESVAVWVEGSTGTAPRMAGAAWRGREREVLEQGEGMTEAFLRCLAACTKARVTALASPPALREAAHCVTLSLRGTHSAVALAALQAALQLLLCVLPAPASMLAAGKGQGGADVFSAAAGQVMVEEGGGVALVRTLLEGANGALPPNHVVDIASTLHAFLVAFAGEASPHVSQLARAWVASAAALHRPSLSEAALAEFVEEATGMDCVKDVRKLKRSVKAFCGGKKKGAA